jgi:hypothetical protein
MMRWILFLICVVAMLTACGTKGEPVEFANACDASHDGKTLEVGGVLSQSRSFILCSNRGGRMECPFDFSATADGEQKITADIEQGTGANTADEIPKGFKKEDLKVRDNNGSPIALGTDKVKATGKMLIAPAAPGGQGVCLMQVNKLER